MKRTVAAFTLLSLILAHAGRGRAQVQPSTVNGVKSSVELADKSAQVDALFTAWSQGRTPGAAVLVVQDGRVDHKKGYGLADVAADIPITPNTAFDIGSISKPFTAMAIMMLAERGKLSYGDPLSRFFPELPSYARKITIWHLLHHTHGFPDYEGLFVKSGVIDKDYPRASKGKREGFEPTIRDTFRLLAQQKELRFAPGDKYEYGGSGYVLLALIIEKVSGNLRRFLEGQHLSASRDERSLLVRYPDQRLTIIVLSNFAEFDRETLVYKIARISGRSDHLADRGEGRARRFAEICW